MWRARSPRIRLAAQARLAGAVLAASACLACSDLDSLPDEPTVVPPPVPPAVVVGIESDLEPGEDFVAWEVQLTVDGEEREPVRFGGGDRQFDFPALATFGPIEPGAQLLTRVSAYTPQSLSKPFLTREAETLAPAEGAHLMRLRLEWECIPNAMLPTGSNAPTCASPETCIGGVCRPRFIAPESLEPYTEDWTNAFADACKPVDAGEPVVEIGVGQTGFNALEDGDLAPVEFGQQGGYHVFFALKMRNLHQAGSVIVLRMVSTDGELELIPVEFKLGFVPGPDGCVRAGLRYPLLYEGQEQGLDVTELLDRPLRVEAYVVDTVGDAGLAQREIVLPPSL